MTRWLEISPEVAREGLSVAVLVARGIDNAKIGRELIAYRRGVAGALAGHWKNRSISSHPAVREYERLHERFGAAAERASPEVVLSYVRRAGDFTSAGPVVDCYNIVSARTLLSNGAHDPARLALPVSLRRLTAEDLFVPLGEPAERRDCSGEYGYVDAERRVICRLDVLQGDGSKLTPASTEAVLFLQGNARLPDGVLLTGSWLLAELLERFCGGDVELVEFHGGGDG